MKRVALALFLITTCTGAGDEAWRACEAFVEERLGVTVESAGDPMIDERDVGWYVRADADAGQGVFTYECVAALEEGEWELLELIVGRPSQ